jgi:hypothetical protein
MTYPNIIHVDQVLRNAKTCAAGLPDGRWVPARSMGFQSFGSRLRATWLVFTGRADALLWERQ